MKYKLGDGTKYKLGDLLEDGVGKLWLVMKITHNKYTLQSCENKEKTWEMSITYADYYKHLAKVS